MAAEQERALHRADLDPDPLRQFARWFDAAAATLRVPEAMALATADADGAPSVRMVLMKAVDERGVVFHTHYSSRKGRELAENHRDISDHGGWRAYWASRTMADAGER